MTLQEILYLLIKSPSIDKNKMEIIKKSLLARVRNYKDLEYIDQVFLKKSYDVSLKLIIIRLRDGQDQEPCKNLFYLVKNAPPNFGEDRFKWIEENSYLKPVDEAIKSEGAKRAINKLEKTKNEMELLKIYARYLILNKKLIEVLESSNN